MGASEKAIVERICSNLKKHGIYHEKTHGNAFERAGRPDLLVIVQGRAFFFEAKRPGEEATPIQRHRMEQIRRSGAFAGVVFSWENVRAFLEARFGADVSDLGPK